LEPAFAFEDQDRLVRLTYSRSPALDEWIATMKAVLADPRFRPGISVLADRSRVPAPTTEYLRGLSSFVETHAAAFRGCAWAMVVPDAVSYGMARMGQALLERIGVTFEIFRDVGEAEHWLRDRWSAAQPC
jgi:hypothetical protein